MARFRAADVENYKATGTGQFFSLANDKDYQQVRLMYNTMDDVELFSVHEIEVNGQTMYVNCLREYDQPLDECPLCKAANRLQVKMWVPLYLPDTQEVKIWERGRTFVSKLESAARRYKPLASCIFEIERNGKKGDQNTTYELIYMSKDETKLEDLPELPEIEGGIVKTLTFDQLQEFVNTGKISGIETKTQTRNPATDRRPAANTEQAPVRRNVRTRTAPQNDEIQDDEIPF